MAASKIQWRVIGLQIDPAPPQNASIGRVMIAAGRAILEALGVSHGR